LKFGTGEVFELATRFLSFFDLSLSHPITFSIKGFPRVYAAINNKSRKVPDKEEDNP
jgi:hypothetical protein